MVNSSRASSPVRRRQGVALCGCRCHGFGVERSRACGARRPGGHGFEAARRPAGRRNRTASGQAGAKLLRMRAAFSTTRAPPPDRVLGRFLSSLRQRVAKSYCFGRQLIDPWSFSSRSIEAVVCASVLATTSCDDWQKNPYPRSGLQLPVYVSASSTKSS